MTEEELRRILERWMEEEKHLKENIKEVAYKIYKKEHGDTMEGLPVETQGYKKVIRFLGYVY